MSTYLNARNEFFEEKRMQLRSQVEEMINEFEVKMKRIFEIRENDVKLRANGFKRIEALMHLADKDDKVQYEAQKAEYEAKKAEYEAYKAAYEAEKAAYEAGKAGYEANMVRINEASKVTFGDVIFRFMVGQSDALEISNATLVRTKADLETSNAALERAMHALDKSNDEMARTKTALEVRNASLACLMD